MAPAETKVRMKQLWFQPVLWVPLCRFGLTCERVDLETCTGELHRKSTYRTYSIKLYKTLL